MLLAAGADVNAKNLRGSSPLDVAANETSRKILRAAMKVTEK
jgi:ankyrin repeat protein